MQKLTLTLFALLAIFAAANATVLVSGQTTTATSGSPVQVAWGGPFPRVPHYWSNPVACGGYTCALSTNSDTHAYADIEVNGQNTGATVTVTSIPTGTTPTISIYQGSTSVGSWTLSSGSNSNVLGQLSSSTYPDNTEFSVWVENGVFAFAPYVSNTNAGFVFSVQ